VAQPIITVADKYGFFAVLAKTGVSRAAARFIGFIFIPPIVFWSAHPSWMLLLNRSKPTCMPGLAMKND
jgi:hypothetical protein